MELQLTADQEEFIQRGIAEGRYASAEDAVRQAMRRWEEVERERAELILALDEADAQFERGEFIELDEDELTEFMESVKRRGRERLGEQHRLAG